MSYTIVSGYHERCEWDRRMASWWFQNTLRWCKPEHIVVITTGCEFPVEKEYGVTSIIGQNMGHVGDILSGKHKNKWCGWSASVLAGAMICYNLGTDYVYKESDCLIKGDCIGEMYKACEGKGMVFGTSALMGVAQSLFLVKHEALMDFVADYMEEGDDTNVANLPENKFKRMEERYLPARYGRHGIPYDRDRPVDWDKPIFYSQQNTEEEINEWISRGFL